MFRDILFFVLLFVFLTLIYEAGHLSGFTEASAICDMSCNCSDLGRLAL